LVCLRFAPAQLALYPAYFVVTGETKNVFHRLLLSTAARKLNGWRLSSG
jgi:hypothetical protein